MANDSREFALFIDGIRMERGLSRSDLIDDIISLSQYKRYLRGAAVMPNDVVTLLVDRLKYDISDIYTLYSKKYSDEDKKIQRIYDMITHHEYEEAYHKCLKMKDDIIVSNFNKQLFEFCFIFVQHKLGHVSDVHVLSQYSELIDYPNCISNESFNLIDINCLSQIVLISSSIDNYEPLNHLYNILLKSDFVTMYSGNENILPFIHYNTSRVLFKKQSYSEVELLTKQGIELSLRHETINALPHLLLLLSLSQLKLGKVEEARINIRKCFLQLLVIDNQNLLNSFKESYNNNFDEPLEDLLKEIKI